MRERDAAGWRVVIASGHAHAYAKAYCPGGASGCKPVMIYGSPRAPEREANRIRKALKDCRQ